MNETHPSMAKPIVFFFLADGFHMLVLYYYKDLLLTGIALVKKNNNNLKVWKCKIANTLCSRPNLYNLIILINIIWPKLKVNFSIYGDLGMETLLRAFNSEPIVHFS